MTRRSFLATLLGSAIALAVPSLVRGAPKSPVALVSQNEPVVLEWTRTIEYLSDLTCRVTTKGTIRFKRPREVMPHDIQRWLQPPPRCLKRESLDVTIKEDCTVHIMTVDLVHRMVGFVELEISDRWKRGK